MCVLGPVILIQWTAVCECELRCLLFAGDHFFRARVVYVSGDGESVRSISVSRGQEPSMKTERREVASDNSGRKLTDRVLEGKSRLYTRISKSDPAIILLFLFGLVLLIGLSVSLCYPTQNRPLPAKPQVSLTQWGIYCWCIFSLLAAVTRLELYIISNFFI